MKIGANARPHGEHKKGRIRRFVALLFTGILVGCVADPNLEESTVRQPTSEPKAEQGGPNLDKPAGALAIPAQPTAETASTPPVQLFRMSRADIIKHLGQPAFQRRDQTALLLRYREGRCILDLYLYPRDQYGPAKAVDYIEARATDGQRLKTWPCIDAVLKANTAG